MFGTNGGVSATSNNQAPLKVTDGEINTAVGYPTIPAQQPPNGGSNTGNGFNPNNDGFSQCTLLNVPSIADVHFLDM